MDRSGSEILDAVDFTPETLLQARVLGAGLAPVGIVAQVHGLGPRSKIILDVGDFLGTGSRLILLTPQDLTFQREADGTVRALTGWTRAQVAALPLFRPESLAQG